MSKKHFTRDDYMQNRCTHRDFYGQFVTESIRRRIAERFGIERLKRAISTDKHLNNIPLAYWDQLSGIVTDQDSLAGRVCVLKEAARQLTEEPDKTCV